MTPYRMQGRGGKNDANDAAAACEAASRPNMRFVPVKSVEQQSALCVHRLREGIKQERTACINRIRGLLAEFGLVFAQSPKALRKALPDVLEDASNEMGAMARLALQRAQQQWQELDEHMTWCDQRVGAHVKNDAQARAAARLHGIGPIGASALVAGVGDFKQFKSGAQFGAWLGVVPKQNSSGAKTVLGRITKRGDEYLRTLLIQGAKSAVMTARKRRTESRRGSCGSESGWAGRRAVVALANKNARILWAVLARGDRFDADHVSMRPPVPTPATRPFVDAQSVLCSDADSPRVRFGRSQIQLRKA